MWFYRVICYIWEVLTFKDEIRRHAFKELVAVLRNRDLIEISELQFLVDRTIPAFF